MWWKQTGSVFMEYINERKLDEYIKQNGLEGVF